MTLNENKTKLIQFTHKCKRPTTISLKVNNTIIENVNQFKLLGLHITNNIKWDNHVTSIIKKCSKRIYFIIIAKRNYCNNNILWSIYYSFLRSIIGYCYPAFCNINKTLFTKLEKKVSKIIGMKPSIPLKLFCESISKQLFKKVNKYDDHPLRKLFIINNNTWTRSNTKIVAPHMKTTKSNNHFIKYSYL